MKEIYLCIEEFDSYGNSQGDDAVYTTSLVTVADRLDCGDVVIRLSDMKQITATEIKLIMGE